MTRAIESLAEVAADYEAIVLDQWGVLHNGTAPYRFAVQAVKQLKAMGLRLAVLSNSGKRSEPNEAQITEIGFPSGFFDCVMTSGEALWREAAAGRAQFSRLYPIARYSGDAEAWAKGLDISMAPVEEAEAVLLMGYPDNAPSDAFEDAITCALRRGIPVICSNPDRTAPRAGGATVVMPGTIAHDYARRGGEVRFIGKPHLPVFRAVEEALDVPAEKLLLVGDSLEHDIAGARGAGWHSAFVRGGLYADEFRSGRIDETISELAERNRAPMPDFTLEYLR